MKTKLTLDKSTKVEIYFEKPSLVIRNLMALDSLAVSMRSPCVVIDPSGLPDLNVIKFQRNSPYKVIGAIDLECKTFGSNKAIKLQNLIEADGFDIGLTAKRSATELHNEIVGIQNFLKMAGKPFYIRWLIDIKHGRDHITECLKAIKTSKTRYEAICLVVRNTEKEVIKSIINKCREELGITKTPIKIFADFNEELFDDKDLNLTYQFKAEELV